MAKHRALKIGPTVPVAQMEATDTIDNLVNVSGPDVFLGRKTAGEGGHEELAEADITEETTPAAGDFLVGFVGGAIRKMDVGNLPGGGGNGIYGGSGSLPTGDTTVTFEDSADALYFSTPGYNFAAFTGTGLSRFSAISIKDSANSTYGTFNAEELLSDNRTYDMPNQSGTVKVGVQYKVYTAIVSQSSTSAPTATVLENTLGGSITWARTSAGLYTGTLTGAFTADKTAFFFHSVMDLVRTSDDVVTMTSASDGLITARTIEIRVYP